MTTGNKTKYGLNPWNICASGLRVTPRSILKGEYVFQVLSLGQHSSATLRRRNSTTELNKTDYEQQEKIHIVGAHVSSASPSVLAKWQKVLHFSLWA